jgi:hypothetical protein
MHNNNNTPKPVREETLRLPVMKSVNNLEMMPVTRLTYNADIFYIEKILKTAKGTAQELRAPLITVAKTDKRLRHQT